MSTVAARQALNAPVDERGLKLAAIKEDQWFDRKSARTQPKSLSEALVGFANAEGGFVIIGISAGVVEGVDSSLSEQNGWRQTAMDLTIPSVSIRAELVECVNQHGRSDHLMIIEVEASNEVHATTKDEVFLRVGDETRKLTYVQRRELEFDKGQTNYETTPMEDVSFDELDDDLLSQYSTAVGHLDARRLLIARGLLTPREHVTVGAMLLFGKSPQTYFPEAHVRVLRYEGTERGAGRRQRLLSDDRFEGAIPHVLTAVRQHVAELMPTRRALGVDGKFEQFGLVPHDAWLEGLVNAVLHRSYSIHGDHVRIELFDDRVEVESPGRFPGIVDLYDARAITRFARNPRIARVCSDLNFGQELGEGIRRIFEEMALAGLASPEYRQTSGSTVLTLRSAPFDRSLDERLPDHARRIIIFVREAEKASTGEIVTSTGLSRPVVLKQLRTLQDEGLIEWSGNSRKDPRAYWRARIE
ncbi:MAG: ATP-binding protein [Acidimicrobiales bacterium]